MSFVVSPPAKHDTMCSGARQALVGGVMRRLTIGAVLAVLVLAGCGWTQPDFDAGRSRGNEMETTLITANASSLVHSTISASTVVGVIGNTIIATGNGV